MSLAGSFLEMEASPEGCVSQTFQFLRITCALVELPNPGALPVITVPVSLGGGAWESECRASTYLFSFIYLLLFFMPRLVWEMPGWHHQWEPYLLGFFSIWLLVRSVVPGG